MKTAELSEYYETLSNELVTNPEKLKAFVNQWSNGFYRYSFGNYCLAMSQKPDFSLLAGYKAWQTKHERIVNKGEKAIMSFVRISV